MPTNGYDPAVLRPLLDEIDAADDRLLSLKGTYMRDCQPIHEDIAAVYVSAKDKGINVKAFKTYVKNHRLDRAKQRNEQKLDLDQRADYEQIRDALGDYGSTPLGAAILERARANEAQLNTLG